MTSCQPCAPLGKGESRASGWVRPVPSVARTRSVCRPGVASHATTTAARCRRWHGPSRAVRHGDSSTCTSTPSIPRCCAQQTPAIATRPAGTVDGSWHVDACHRAHRCLRRPASPGPVGLLLAEYVDGSRHEPLGGRHGAVQTRHHHAHREAVLTGSGSPFMAMATIASRPSVTAAIGVLAVHPSTDRDSSWSAPGVDPGVGEEVLHPHTEPPRVPGVGPPTSFETQVRVRSRSTSGGREQVRVGERVGAVHHAADRQRPGRRVDRGDGERGVDPVEVGVGHPGTGDAADADVDRAGECRRGVVGHRQPDGRARGRDVAAPTPDDLAQRPGDDRETGHRQDAADDRPPPRHDRGGTVVERSAAAPPSSLTETAGAWASIRSAASRVRRASEAEATRAPTTAGTASSAVAPGRLSAATPATSPTTPASAIAGRDDAARGGRLPRRRAGGSGRS